MEQNLVERVARLEERDTARERRMGDLGGALKENADATKELTTTIQKMQLNAAYDKGKERTLTGIICGCTGLLGTVAGHFWR